MGLILYGPQIVDGPDHGLEEMDEGTYNDEQKAEMWELYRELPTALNIVMFTGKFEPGHYKTKTYLRNWKKS